MLKRLNKLWRLSKKDPKAIEAITEGQIDQLPDAGDGGAVFFGEGSPDEWKEESRDRKGLKGLFGL